MKEKNTKEKVIDYTPVISKILVSLYVIIAVLVVNTVLMIVSLNDTDTKTNANTGEENINYDPSKLTEMTTTQALATITGSDLQVIYIGRAGCGYCAKFIPTLEEAQKAFNYKTIYLDLDKITTDDQEKITALGSDVKENFGYTPMVLLAKDGKLVNMHVGYIDYTEFEKFLTDNGMKK